MDIKIIVAAHKKSWMPENKIYVPLQVGRGKNPDIMGYLGDDTGDNISSKNPTYCELTGIYWAWKNLPADYLGVVHYRRFFTKKGFFCRSVEKKKSDVLEATDWGKVLCSCDIVVADKRKYYIETNQTHYLHAHPQEQFYAAKDVIEKKYPEYMTGWNIMMNRTWAHMFNMFVMKREYFNEFCTWWFDVMFEVEKHVDMTGWDKKEQRWFIDELLLDVWLETKGYRYREINVDFFEKQNWFIKGGKFLKRKFRRNK